MLAFLDVAALGNASTGLGELFDEMNAVHQQFMTFSEAVLVAIVKQCGLTREQITSTSIVDPKTVEPIIFVDEDTIARWVEKTHERVVGGQKQSKGPPGR
jgi:pyruvate/2-oxoglutarate/acetoin dehydrogenase E1 component